MHDDERARSDRIRKAALASLKGDAKAAMPAVVLTSMTDMALVCDRKVMHLKAGQPRPF